MSIANLVSRSFVSVLIIVIVLVTSVLLGVFAPVHGFVLAGAPVLMAVALVLFESPRLGIYLLAFLIPLQYLTKVGSQATAIRYLGWLVFAAWLLKRSTQKSSFRSLLNRPTSRAMVAFLLWAFVSVLWSPLEDWRIFFFTFLQLAGMALVFVDLVNSPERLERFLLFLLAGGVVSAGVAVYEYARNISHWQLWSRALGGFGDGNYSSAAYMYVLPYASFLINYRSGWKKSFALASVPILLAAVGATASRAGLLSIPIWLLLVLRKLPKRDYRMRWLLGTLCLALLAVRFWPWATIEYRMSHAWSGGNPDDLSGRVYLWHYALEKFVQRPLTGYGLTTVLANWSRFVPHNLFLQVAIRLGFPGLLGILWLLWGAWRSIAAAYRRVDASGQTEMASLLHSVQDSMLLYLFFSFTLDTATARLLWLVFALGEISSTCVGHRANLVNSARVYGKVRTRTSALTEPWAP